MIKLNNMLGENYSHIRHLVSDLNNLYYVVDNEKLKKIILDLIPNGSQYTYTPQKSDFYIKKFSELETLSKKVVKPNTPAFKAIQKIVKGGLDFWNQTESVKEGWSQKYKKSINCNNPKGFSQKAHCAGRKKNESMASKLTVEQKMELFLEKNCPTDPEKWSASKSAAKRKFDVYPSAYANGWAAKNYKSKGGGWKKCK